MRVWQWLAGSVLALAGLVDGSGHATASEPAPTAPVVMPIENDTPQVRELMAYRRQAVDPVAWMIRLATGVPIEEQEIAPGVFVRAEVRRFDDFTVVWRLAPGVDTSAVKLYRSSNAARVTVSAAEIVGANGRTEQAFSAVDEAGVATLSASPAPGASSDGWLEVRAAVIVPSTAFTVTNTNDSGAGSLRQALIEANAAVGGAHVISISATGTINLLSALPQIVNISVAINGPGADSLTINRSSGGNYAIFATPGILYTRAYGFSGMRLQNGAGGSGAIAITGGSTTLNACVIANNLGTFAGGGVGLVSSTITITNTTFSNNRTPLQGAAINAQGSALTISNSTFSGNQITGTSGIAGAIQHFASSQPLTLANVTFSGNTSASLAAGRGVALECDSPGSFRNTIFNGQSPQIGGGGCNSLGNNLSSDGSGNLNQAGDLPNSNPLLSALGDLGGSTSTHALLPGSPAIDAGTSTGAPATDQRGIARVGAVDIGAFESRGFTITRTTGNAQTATINTAFASPLGASVVSAASEPVQGGVVRFTAPGSGASATLSSPSATIAASGEANTTATANGSAGSYTVNANAAGATGGPLSYALTNEALAVTADLAITITDEVSAETPGSVVTYRIVTSNAGPTAVTGAMVSDSFPATLSACSWLCIAGAGAACPAAGSGNISAAVSLPVGAQATFHATCLIDAGATGTLTSTASIAMPAGGTDPVPGNNTASDSDTLDAVLPPRTRANWTQISSGTPSARINHGMAHDPLSGLSLVFGGVSGGFLNDLYQYQPSTGWAPVAAGTPLPSARRSHSFAAGNGSAYLYAGVASAGSVSDFWRYTPGSGWVQLDPGGASSPTHPGVRLGATALFDPVRNQFVFFGGRRSGTPTNETWAFQLASNTWLRLDPGGSSSAVPAARESHSLVYDPDLDAYLLFGGDEGGSTGNPHYNDIWLYLPGSGWTLRDPGGVAGPDRPTLRSTPAMAYDSVRKRHIMHGGSDILSFPQTFHNNTWEYDAATNRWREIEILTPLPTLAASAGMAFDTTIDRIVIADGRNEANASRSETYELRLVGESTSTAITADLPDPSALGQAVPIDVSVTGDSSQPANGQVVVTASTGESCTDTTATSGAGTTALFSCAITFNTTGMRDLTAEYSASASHADSTSATEPHTVLAPALTLTKTASASPWTVGVPASYTLQVQNTGPVATTAVATITDTIPSGLTIGTLPGNCSSAGQTVTCTIAAGLAASGSTSFVIPVTPAAAAGASVTNTATVSGGGDPACPAAARCTSTAGPTPVQMAVATQLVFGQQPTNTTGGAAITPAPTVRLLDAFGNPTTSTANVTIAIGSNPGGGTLSGTATVAAVAGLASFPGLSIDAAGSGYTFTASSAGLSGATSSAFDVVVGAPAQLAFGQQPTNTAAGAVITPAPTVRILDAGGNLTTSMASISVALGNNPGSATLGGTTTVAASGGIATFPGLMVSNGGTGYTLTASGAGATGTTSAAFNISCPATVVTTSADSGAGSLRQIIADACPGSTITFASSIDTVELSSAEIAVSKPLTIDGGTGVVVTRLAGSPAFRHFLVSASLTLNQLELLGGEASGSFPDGGAIHLSSGTLTLRSCRLSGNAAQLPSGSGGAVFAGAGTTLNVLNSLVSGNRADGGFGGGILNRGSLFLINATVAGNFAGTSGGGVSNLGSYSADVRNSILYGNEAPHAPEISANVGFNSVRTIIGIDPLFVERVDASDNAPTTAGDYRLDDFSSAIDSGSNALIPAGVVTDVDGNPRRVDDANEPDSGIGTAPIVDVGAYERQIDSMFGVVEVTPTSLVVSEAGPTSDSFVISLDRAPRSDVTIELSFDANVVVDSGSGFGPSPQTVTLTPANALTGVTVTVQAVDDAIVEASPHFSTIITAVTSSAAPAHNGLMVDDVTVTIADNDVVIAAVDDAGTVANGASGGTAVANVLTNDTLDGGAATLANVTLTQVSTTHPNVSLNAATGALSVAPATAAGSYSVVYQICEQSIPTNCDTANVSVSVGAAVIDAVDDSGTVASGASGGIAVPNVLVNDTLDGSPATLATVSLTQDGTTSPQVTLNPATGEVNVAAATAVGIYVVSYRICEQLNPANCDLATINVDVGAAVIDAVEDSGAVAAGATGGGTAVANVLVNDTLDGSLVVAGEVTLSQVSVSHPNLALNPSSGAVTATAGMPVGSHTLVYQICEMLNPTSCDSATVTVQALAPPALSISSPSQSEGNGGTSTMNFVVSIAAPFALDVGFNASTADGSATTADNDYLALALTPFTISAGQTSVSVPVSINGDTTFEGNESFALNLTDIRNATPGALTGTGTIEDDDLQPTTTVIDSISPSTTVVGQPYTVAVMVTAQIASPTGSVTISDGTTSCSAPLSAGAVPASSMSCSLASLTVGTKTLTASYLPDSSTFDASSSTASHPVTAAATTISVTDPARSRINQPTAFSFTLAATAPGAGTPTGSVTLTSGSSSCTATLPATSCDLSFDTLGSRTVTASYAGDANYLASDSGAAGSLQTLVYALADVSISKTDGLATYAPNDLIVYTVQVRNAGPDDAAQIRVQDILPTSLLSVIWFADPASGTGDLDLVLATLPAGAMEDFTIYGRVNGSPEQVVNTATLTLPADTTVEDPNPGNNSATDVNLLEGLFEDGFESPAVTGPAGSLRLPTAALAPLLDSVARVVYRLDDDHGDVARIYARLDGEAVEYALAKRGPDGRWTLGAWQSYAQEPTLAWHAVLVGDRWQLTEVELH